MTPRGGSLRDDVAAVLAESIDRIAGPGREEREKVVYHEERLGRHTTDGREVAAPFPVLASLGDTGSNRVLEHVPARREEVLVRGYELTPESSAEQMIHAPVTHVVGRGIRRIQLAHSTRDPSLADLHDEVVVVSHQAVGVEDPTVAPRDSAEDA